MSLVSVLYYGCSHFTLIASDKMSRLAQTAVFLRITSFSKRFYESAELSRLESAGNMSVSVICDKVDFPTEHFRVSSVYISSWQTCLRFYVGRILYGGTNWQYFRSFLWVFKLIRQWNAKLFLYIYPAQHKWSAKRSQQTLNRSR